MSNKMDNILKYFFEEPEREFHIRELARLTKKAPTTISKYLSELQKQKILLSRRALNHLLYKADTESSAFKMHKLTHNINQIIASGIIDFLNEELDPQAIVLFGSFRKAENIKTSDIDILTVASNKKELSLAKFEKKLRHKIQLFIHSQKDILRMSKTNKELVNNWVNGMVLSGFWELK